MASAFNAFLAAMWIERNIRGATLHRKQKQKQMKKNKMLSDAKKVLYLVLMFACSGPAYAGIVKGIASKIVEAGFCGMTFWTVPLFAICLCGGRMPLRPYIFTIDSLGMRWWIVSFIFCFSPLTVGAYRIRPDVGEKGKTAASNPSLFRENPHRLACSPPWRAYAIRPYIFTIDSLGVRWWIVSFRFCFSP